MFTALTFAPVQGFIERSRKLRDLYGSSSILSHLAHVICTTAKEQGYEVISPALINVSQGTPNQIIIAGNFPKNVAEQTFQDAWNQIVLLCKDWLEANVCPSWLNSTDQAQSQWTRVWNLWSHHCWEFFWAQGATITDARMAINDIKRSRAWIGINWTGESSTLSGADGIAWPGYESQGRPDQRDLTAEDHLIKEFYTLLSQELTTLVDANEQLSIPELIKRLITWPQIATQLKVKVQKYSDLNRWEHDVWTGWFQGDGDGVGTYLKSMQDQGHEEASILNRFSHDMLTWGTEVLQPSITQAGGKVIYAGGDDFLGVFYPDAEDEMVDPQGCIEWFEHFQDTIWSCHGHPIGVSVGFVFAGHQVPQRDVLQHCKEAEQSAKHQGKNRLAIRILFNSGNHLEWVCPWQDLGLIFAYQDRDGGSNWTHIYNDVIQLENRHAFKGKQKDVALALFNCYFPSYSTFWQDDDTWIRIFGHEQSTCPATVVNTWIVNLAKVGFQIYSRSKDKIG